MHVCSYDNFLISKYECCTVVDAQIFHSQTPYKYFVTKSVLLFFNTLKFLLSIKWWFVKNLLKLFLFLKVYPTYMFSSVFDIHAINLLQIKALVDIILLNTKTLEGEISHTCLADSIYIIMNDILICTIIVVFAPTLAVTIIVCVTIVVAPIITSRIKVTTTIDFLNFLSSGCWLLPQCHN